jgi:hypothetical protein
MTATLLAPPDEIIRLTGISWTTYETLLEELSDRRLRLTYNHGNLEMFIDRRYCYLVAAIDHNGLSSIGESISSLGEESDRGVEYGQIGYSIDLTIFNSSIFFAIRRFGRD